MGKIITYYKHNPTKNIMERINKKDIKAFSTKLAENDLHYVTGKLLDSSYLTINNQKRLDLIGYFYNLIFRCTNKEIRCASVIAFDCCLDDGFFIYGHDLNENWANKIMQYIEGIALIIKSCDLNTGRSFWKWNQKALEYNSSIKM